MVPPARLSTVGSKDFTVAGPWVWSTLPEETTIRQRFAVTMFFSTWSCANVTVTNYVDQQTLKPDDDYVLPHQRLWMFDVLVCPLSVTERFLLQPLVCGTVFHRTSLLPPLSPSSAVVLNHTSSHFLIRLSDSSLICTVPAQ